MIKMTTFNAIIDDLGRIALPREVRELLNVKHSGDPFTIEIDFDETEKPIITLTAGTMETKMPKEEEIIVNFVEFDDRNKVIKITKEQLKLLDWLCENEYLVDDVAMGYGYPSVNDLTK